MKYSTVLANTKELGGIIHSDEFLVIKLEDLKSRLNAILEAKIMQPDDELMKLVLIKIFNDKQLLINPNVINFLKSRLERSYKSINDFIEKIDKFSLEKGKKITIALINDLIK